MNGLKIINLKIFNVQDIYKVGFYLGGGSPKVTDLPSMDNEDIKWLWDYKGDVNWQDMVGDPAAGDDTIFWSNILTPGELGTAELMWKELGSFQSVLDLEYVPTELDKVDGSFNTIILYDIMGDVLSYGYMDQPLDYSLVNSIHLVINLTSSSRLQDVIVKIYRDYHVHSLEVADIGLTHDDAHPKLRSLGLTHSQVDMTRYNNYVSRRNYSTIVNGATFSELSPTKLQILNNTLFSKLTDHRMYQKYLNIYFDPTEIRSKLLSVSGMITELYMQNYTVNDLIKYTFISIDPYYGVQLITYGSRFIVITPSWTNYKSLIYVFPEGSIPLCSVNWFPRVHTYYRNVLIGDHLTTYRVEPRTTPYSTSSKTILGKLITYEIYLATVTRSIETYLPVNFDLGNLVALVSGDSISFENLYNYDTTSRDSFSIVMDHYYSNSEDTYGIDMMESNYKIEVELYLELKKHYTNIMAMDTGVLVILDNSVVFYPYFPQGHKSSRYELSRDSSTEIYFMSNDYLYAQEFDTSVTTKMVKLGTESDWSTLSTKTLGTVFRAYRGINLQITTEGALII